MAIIGNSDLDIFRLSLGGNPFGWTADEKTSFEILDSFAEAGANFIDTSDSYTASAPGNSGGESETIIGKWITDRGLQNDIAVATKVGSHPDFKGLKADNIAAAAEASLQRLQTDCIDLYYAHFDDPQTPLEETLEAFNALVVAGKVRYLGISNYSPDRVREWLRITEENGYAAPIALQPHYNLVHRKSYEPELAQIATDNNISVFPYFALASGFLTGKYKTRADIEGSSRERLTAGYFSDAGLDVVAELATIAQAHDSEISTVALAWLLTRPGITAPIASVSRPEQLPALLDAPNLVLSSNELDTLERVSAAVGA
ncbi:aldo/keto reductase [Rhodococcus qingshengii]|uniref:aldo/keto reductase n=1 Tax=Rhodococcus qingshengii TaxID=334542 RepID=UPI001C8CAD28|nr:aldo/keto reductase [Rhodococcus qingshengii]MBX9147052.1 aldo/keto reductase [Rhodococcus qingshengii]